MPIEILTGNNTLAIKQQVATHKGKLDPNWWSTSCHQVDAQAGIDTVAQKLKSLALNLPLGSPSQLIVVEPCELKGTEAEPELTWLNKITDHTTLLLVCPNLDKRLKITKYLLALGQLQTFTLPQSWQTSEIEDLVNEAALRMGVRLTKAQIAHLASAAGSDPWKIQSSLKIIQLVPKQNLTSQYLLQLIPNHNHTTLQLADAVRQKQERLALAILSELENLHPNEVVATLVTQFRTWLLVKKLSDTIKNSTELARQANVANPNRIYYLRQEVENTTLQQLQSVFVRLNTLKFSLMTGKANRDLMHCVVLECCQP
jgi:DNA polymerase-3 subunit delta